MGFTVPSSATNGAECGSGWSPLRTLGSSPRATRPFRSDVAMCQPPALSCLRRSRGLVARGGRSTASCDLPVAWNQLGAQIYLEER